MKSLNLDEIISKKICIGRQPVENSFSVAFGVNDKFADALGILLTSLAVNNPHRNIDVYVGTEGISEKHINRMCQFVEQYPHVSISLYMVNGELLADYCGRKNPTAAYYRVVMAKVLYPDVKRLLYMDVDTLFLGKVEAFEALEWQDEVFFAVEDTLKGKSLRDHKKELGLKESDRYFNSGVMYIDLQRWNEHGISQKVVALLHERALGKRNFSFMDQGAINMAAVGLWGKLHDGFNLMIPMLRERYHGELLPDTVILHFAGAYKPWAGCTVEEARELSENCVEMVLFDEYKNKSFWSDFAGYKKNYKTLRLISRWMWQKAKIYLAVKWYLKYLREKTNK